MNANLQMTTFTHGKCTQCSYLALLDKFESKKINESITEGEDGFRSEFYQLILTCPLCGNENCEAVFPNEVN